MRGVGRVAWIATTLVFIGASAVMNYDVAHGLGTDPRSAVIFGTLSVAADLAKAVAPIVIAGAWAARAYGRALVSGLLFALTLVMALNAALGFGSVNRGGLLTTRENLNAALRDAVRDEADARVRLAALPAARPGAVVAADLASLRRERAWESSKGCSDATSSASRDLCRSYERLNGEAAAAAEAAVLDRKIERLGAEIGRLRGQGAGSEADPQASGIARLLRPLFGNIDHGLVRSGLALLFAATVEGFSAFGLWCVGFMHGGRASNGAAAVVSEAESVVAGGTVVEEREIPVLSADVLGVDVYGENRLQAGGSVSLDELLADYEREARRLGLVAMSKEAFVEGWELVADGCKMKQVDGRYIGMSIGAGDAAAGA